MVSPSDLCVSVVYPDGQVEVFALTADETILGREASAGIALPDAKVSRRHARIVRRDDGLWLEDLGSANGVLLDGLPLSGQALITPGSLIEVGDSKLTVQAARADARQPGEAAPRYASPVGALEVAGTRFALKAVAGELLGQTFLLSLEETIVGRSDEADVTLDVPSISRRHASIRAKDDRHIVVDDLGSANGTFVGDAALSAPETIAVGDRVRFGSLVFELTIAQPPDERAATEPLAPVAEPLEAGARGRLPTEPVAEGAAPREAPRGRAAPPAQGSPAPADGGSEPKSSQSTPGPAPASVAPSGRAPRKGPGPLPLARGATAAAFARLARVGRAFAQPQLLRRLARPLGVGIALVGLGLGGRTIVGRLHVESRQELVALAEGALNQAIGFGPRAAERAWRQRRDEQLAAAEALYRAGEWEPGLEAVKKAAATDPTHAPLLHLRARLERAARADAATQAASNHRSASRFSQAMLAASDALEELDGEQHPAVTARRGELDFIVHDSRQHLARFCSEEARIACGQERYENCLTEVACALGYAADNEEALAALNLASSVVDSKNVARPVRGGAGEEEGIDVGSAPVINAQRLRALYPNEKVRLGMLTYAAGDRPLATLRLRNLDESSSRAALADINALANKAEQGSTSEQAGAWEAALAAYEEGLVIDARLLPREVASAPRAQLTEGAQRVFLTLGNLAFARADWAEARSHWQRGEALSRRFLPLSQAVAKLEALAEARLAEAKAGKKTLGAALFCQKLEETLAMTANTSLVHQQAEALASACPKAKR